MSNIDLGVIYYNSNYLNVLNGGVSAWQGSRNISPDLFLICGTTNPSPQTGQGIIYSGNIAFTNGSIYYMQVPLSEYTSVYGPNYNFDTGIYNFVGSYSDYINSNTKGFIYTGKLSTKSLETPDNYSYPDVNCFYDIVFVHSISNGYCVGNAGNVGNVGNPDQSDTFAFLYNINDLTNPIEIIFPGSNTTTAYGIWYNKLLNTYTIVGGFSPEKIPINRIYYDGLSIPIGQSFIVDYDPVKNSFSSWTILDLPLKNTILSHIQGISGFFDYDQVYSLSIDAINNEKNKGYYATITRDSDFNFVVTKFVEVKYSSNGISSINSVANNSIVGINIGEKGNQSFQATILG